MNLHPIAVNYSVHLHVHKFGVCVHIMCAHEYVCGVSTYIHTVGVQCGCAMFYNSVSEINRKRRGDPCLLQRSYPLIGDCVSP